MRGFIITVLLVPSLVTIVRRTAFGGGADALGALQAAAITVGLPFTLVLLAMCITLYMGLKHEERFVLNAGK